MVREGVKGKVGWGSEGGCKGESGCGVVKEGVKGKVWVVREGGEGKVELGWGERGKLGLGW